MSKNKPLDHAGEIRISIVISNDREIQKLNKDYLDKDAPTDVLSFSMNEEMEDGSLYLGDVIVNLEQAKKQASEYGNTVEEEVAQLVEHGILHLLDVHHEGDDEK